MFSLEVKLLSFGLFLILLVVLVIWLVNSPDSEFRRSHEFTGGRLRRAWNALLGANRYKVLLAAVGIFLGAYVGVFLIMLARHELHENRAAFKLANFRTLVGSGKPGAFISAMANFGPLQNYSVPPEPELLEPWKWFGEQVSPNKKRLADWAREYLMHCVAEKCGDSNSDPKIRIVLTEANLSGAELRRVDLHRAHLHRANLRGAKLHGADLHGAHLSRAYLFETRLPAARLSGANLRNAYLGGAYLEEANLSGANLSGANLFRANLKGAKLQNAYLGGADLREAIGLTVAQLKAANYWEEAIYSDDLLKKLDLPENHNETLEKKWTEFRRKEREEWGLP